MTDAIRSYPLLRAVTQIQLILNQFPLNLNTDNIQPLLEQLDWDAQETAMQPTTLDQYPTYDMARSLPSTVNGSIIQSGGLSMSPLQQGRMANGQEGRGAWNIVSITNPLGGTTASVQFIVVSPIFQAPEAFSMLDKVGGLVGLQTLSVQLNNINLAKVFLPVRTSSLTASLPTDVEP